MQSSLYPSRQLATASGIKIPLIANSWSGYSVNATISEEFNLQLDVTMSKGNVIIECSDISRNFTVCPPCYNTAGLEEYGTEGYCMNATSYSIKIGSYVNTEASAYLLLGYRSAKYKPASSFGLAPVDEWNRSNSLFDSISRFSLKVDGNDSYLLLGAVDKSVTTDSTLQPYMIPTKNETTWELKPTAVRFGADAEPWYPCGGYKENPNCGLFLSVEEDDIVMEGNDYMAFRMLLMDDYECSILLECPQTATLPSVTISIGDTSIVLEDDDYTAAIPDKPDWKEVMIKHSQYRDRYTLGMSFLANHYAVFDNNDHAVTLYCSNGCVAETLVAEAMPTRSPSRTRSPSSTRSTVKVKTRIVLTTKGKIIIGIVVAIPGLAVAGAIIGQMLKFFCGIDIFETKSTKEDEVDGSEANASAYTRA